MTTLRERDPFDVRLAREAPELLRVFNDAGVVSTADVQVARRLAALVGVEDPALLLAFALAVRAPRLGHVLVDLQIVRTTVAVDTEEPVDLDALPWPDAEEWVEAVAGCELVATDDDGDDLFHPMRLVGTALYLNRYWREERDVAADVLTRAASAPGDLDTTVLAAGLDRLCRDDRAQRQAADVAMRRHFTVVAGGPGTGKTTTVACIAALAMEQAAATARPAPLIALAAPTGKAAARLEEQLHHQAAHLGVADDVRVALTRLQASTLHRLLGWRPGTHSRFRHDRFSRLPHDIVIVDEASMVSLTLMSRLLEAVRPDARLVLVGDPDQLASIEAGAVLGDLVRARRGVHDGVVVLEHVYRFGEAIGAVATAVRAGDDDAVIQALSDSPAEVTWIPGDAPGIEPGLEPVRAEALRTGRVVIEAARAGDGAAALEALGGFRLLCGHRRGPYGVSTWMPRVEAWLAPDIDAAGGGLRDYAGRPLLITANDYDLDLFNGDTGVVISDGFGGLTAAFERRGQVVTVRPSRLSSVETVYAMTVHKSQGSQFRTAAVVVPPSTSRILTRELLYTAVTRARDRLIVVGTEDAIRAAVRRPAARASGLRERLGM
jgi:exodeoxyribonuclease V alpha subunit